MLHSEWLKSLPVPTSEQTLRFTEHVVDNHSWYKHLPFFPPGASFVFFPNPHAGRGVMMDGDRFTVHDIPQGNYLAHPSRLPTAEYLTQFGHWDYWVDDNPRVSDLQPGPWLFSADGSQRELLGDDLKRAWSCRLTAFLKPAPPMFDLRANEWQRESDAFTAASRQILGSILRGLFGWRRQGPTEDRVVERYRAMVEQRRRDDDPSRRSALLPIMVSEAQAQRQIVLDTLQNVREAWSHSQGGSAEPILWPND